MEKWQGNNAHFKIIIFSETEMSFICSTCIRKIGLTQCRRFSSKTSRIWASPVKKFQNLLDKRPIFTNAMIGGIFMFAGDLTQQLYFNPVIKWKEVYSYTYSVFKTLNDAQNTGY